MFYDCHLIHSAASTPQFPIDMIHIYTRKTHIISQATPNGKIKFWARCPFCFKPSSGHRSLVSLATSFSHIYSHMFSLKIANWRGKNTWYTPFSDTISSPRVRVSHMFSLKITIWREKHGNYPPLTPSPAPEFVRPWAKAQSHGLHRQRLCSRQGSLCWLGGVTLWLLNIAMGNGP